MGAWGKAKRCPSSDIPGASLRWSRQPPPARAVLEEKPTDPEANLTVGRYLCLVKGDWEKGISMLALGSDPALNALAVKDMWRASSPDQQVNLGDDWWELAETKQGAEKEALMLRAGSWYRSAQPKVSGLVRVKIDDRLEEIAEIGRPVPKVTSGQLELPRPAQQWDVESVQLLRTLEGHTGYVTSVVFSPDGSILASTSFDKTVRLWDVGTGRLQRTLEGHEGIVWCASFSPQGTILASAANGPTKLWDVTSGKLQRTLSGHAAACVVFNRDGSMLATGGWDKAVELRNSATGGLQWRFEGHMRHVSSVAFSPDGFTLASGSLDNTVILWNLGTGQVRRKLKGHTEGIRSVAFSPDGSTLASASLDYTVRLWNVGTGEVRRTLKGHTHDVTSATFSSDGQVLASTGGRNDRTLRFWDVATGTLLRTLPVNATPEHVAFAPNGFTLASGTSTTIRLWRIHANRIDRKEAELRKKVREATKWMPVPSDPRAVTLIVNVDGVERSALVYPGIRARVVPSPVLLYFHGFSGTSKGGARGQRFQEFWPGATVVYPQGLSDIAGRGGGKPAPVWVDARHGPWHVENREIRFVDRLLKELSARWKVDPRRIYATGYSNGGCLTFLLLLERPDLFAAFAPAASYGLCAKEAQTPRPVMYIFGEQDDCFDHDKADTSGSELMKQTLDALLELNRCNDENKTALPGGLQMFRPKAGGQPVAWYLHKGGHSLPDGASELIVRFFQQHSLDEGD